MPHVLDRLALLRIQAALSSAATHSRHIAKVKYQKANPLALLLRVALLTEEEHTNGISVTDVANAMGVSQSGISRAVRAAVKGCVMKAVPMPSDRRSTCLELTPRGAAFVDEVLLAMHKAIVQERRRLQK